MIKSKYFEKARRCVDKYFHDCELKGIALSKNVRKTDRSKFLNVDGRETDIVCSRTSKVVLEGGLHCESCDLTSKYALILFNRNSKTMALSFVCVNPEDNEFVPLTKDHIVPKALGGTDTMKNLQPMCYTCNQEKACVHENSNGKNATKVTITYDEYSQLNAKQAHFAQTRNFIKKSIKRLPWWMKLLRIDKYIEKTIKNPVHDLGYYGNNISGSDKK